MIFFSVNVCLRLQSNAATQLKCRHALALIMCLFDNVAGASTPYKAWSKCSIIKLGGEDFSAVQGGN